MMRAGEASEYPALPLIAWDNLALAAMDDRIFRKRRRAPAQQALWPAAANGGVAAPPPSRRCDQEPAYPREHFVQRAVVFRKQQRQAEHTAPYPPFGGDLADIGTAKEQQRQGGISMFERDREHMRRLVGLREQLDGNTAIGGDRQIHGHAHAGARAPQHHAFAMQIDDA
jgi:hypothetical protein